MSPDATTMTSDADADTGRDTTRRIAILVNPAAGRHDLEDVEALAAALRACGAAVDVVIGRRPGHLVEGVEETSADTVVAVGGDGTINVVVEALLARPEPRPRLAVLPQGTANVLAHEFALPSAPEALATAILAGRTRPMHLGRATSANGHTRPFFLMVSAGFDAAVVQKVEKRAKRRFKKLAFLWTALTHPAGDLPEALVTLTDAEGATTRLRAATVVVTKARHYGGPFVLSRQTSVDYPGLRLVALKTHGLRALAVAGLRLLLGTLETWRHAVALPVVHARLSSSSRLAELPVQIDGEPWGTTPVVVEATTERVDVVVG